MTHQNIQREICGPERLDLVKVILRGPHCKFSALGPEFLVTALVTTALFVVVFKETEVFGTLNH